MRIAGPYPQLIIPVINIDIGTADLLEDPIHILTAAQNPISDVASHRMDITSLTFYSSGSVDIFLFDISVSIIFHFLDGVIFWVKLSHVWGESTIGFWVPGAAGIWAESLFVLAGIGGAFVALKNGLNFLYWVFEIEPLVRGAGVFFFTGGPLF